MSHAPRPIKASDHAVVAYRAALQTFAAHGAAHEGATETAFGRLLTDTAKAHGWTLIPKKGMKSKATKKHIYPDGTVDDEYYLPRGYWEAKDTDDDLDAEIRKKIAAGYPLTNTIFEDTRQAVLYQNGRAVDVYDLTKPDEVAELLNDFYKHAEPDIEGFHQAVAEFQERVPQLAQGLVAKIDEAHQLNKKFQEAFATFFELCKTTLNPNIRREAVDEMLVQHLLTERVFRTIFRESDFINRNVIAVEVERVIAALVSQSFSRDAFLRSLDKFYKAIEKAAEEIEDFQEKQAFLNTVYERFFQGYSVKTADTHGIVYTPQPLVNFMCESVEEVLRTEFGLSLGHKDVVILDPCTGTGNFVVNLLRRVPGPSLERVYKQQLFANEVMLLPYYVAALNIEHAYFERSGTYAPFDGLCFADTLDLVHERQPSLFSERNAERIEREKFAPVNAIIGNPPYNVGQLNENDNNKNRKYDEIDRLIKATYAKDSKATSVSKLNDPYVKFFRWATDRLKGRDGVVCYVTNNSFVEQIAFDGMRKHLLRDFTRVYHLHLEGNVRQNPKLSGTAYNVFGIQVGVGITIAVKSAKHKEPKLFFHRVDKNVKRAGKLALVESMKSIGGVAWGELTPDKHNNWLVPENTDEFEAFIPVGSKEGKMAKEGRAKVIFKEYSLGVATHRDRVVYGFDKIALGERIKTFIKAYNAEVDRFRREGNAAKKGDFDWDKAVAWDRDLKRDAVRGKDATYHPDQLRLAMYRPFTSLWLYFDRLLNAEVYSITRHFPEQTSEAENWSIWLKTGTELPTYCLAVRRLTDLMTQGGSQCFPFYVYDEDGTNRRENVTDWALKQFRTHYKDKKITKWDIFHYVYGLLHHPGYRTKYADNLKKSLPRIPFAPDFQAFVAAGKELAEMHVGYEQLEPYPLTAVEKPGVPYNPVVTDKMKLSKDHTELRVNDALTLAGIPPEVFQYRLGNRSALEWVIDQYQVSEDKRSGIRSDPNRPDDPGYIVRLIGQVVRVSVDTVRIVAGLPAEFEPPPA